MSFLLNVDVRVSVGFALYLLNILAVNNLTVCHPLRQAPFCLLLRNEHCLNADTFLTQTEPTQGLFVRASLIKGSPSY